MSERVIPLSLPRRFMNDLMYFGAKFPIASVQRVMDFSALIAARKKCHKRPPWAAILAKAYGLTAQEFPELRRVFLTFPWPRIYECPVSVASITVNRDFAGEPAVFTRQIKAPETMRISDLADIIYGAGQVPLMEIREFKRLLQTERLPLVLRRLVWWTGLNVGRWRVRVFGTFGITSVASMGTGALYTPTPTNLLSIDVFEPDGHVPVHYFFDHRLFDWVTLASSLARLEEILNGPILEELCSMAKL
jgi:hypothetical protein